MGDRKRCTDEEWQRRDPSSSKRMLTHAIHSANGYNRLIEEVPVPERPGVKSSKGWSIDTKNREANRQYRDNWVILDKWYPHLLHRHMPANVYEWLHQHEIVDKSGKWYKHLQLTSGISIFGTDKC